MTMDGTLGKLIPFYLVIDVSYSMAGDKLNQANQIVPEVADTLAQNPIIADKVRFSVVDFSDDATVVLPMCDLLAADHLPQLTVRGGTSFAAAFTLLRSVIENDVRQLKADGFDVHRPAVFFISDGEPTDTDGAWEGAFDALTTYDKASGIGFTYYPNVIPFGVDKADGKTMAKLIHPKGKMKLYMADDSDTAGQAISRCAEILISSVVQSASNVGAGLGGLVLPDPDDLPEGIAEYDDDDWL